MVFKKFKLIFIPYGLILIAFLGILTEAIIKFIDVFNHYGHEFTLKSAFAVLGSYSVFKALALILIPTMAVLFKSKLSWVIITSYFYFIIFNVFGQSYFQINYEGFEILSFAVGIFILIVCLILIIIMNRYQVYIQIYNFKTENRSFINIASFILGSSVSLLLVIINNSHYLQNLKL